MAHLCKGGFVIKDKKHFYSIASRAMRQVLVDLARKRLALRRGEGEAGISIDNPGAAMHVAGASPEQVLALGIQLEKLEEAKRAAARVFDMHYVAGLTFEEVAEVTGLTVRQVRHLWQKAQNWLKDRL